QLGARGERDQTAIAVILGQGLGAVQRQPIGQQHRRDRHVRQGTHRLEHHLGSWTPARDSTRPTAEAMMVGFAPMLRATPINPGLFSWVIECRTNRYSGV